MLRVQSRDMGHSEACVVGVVCCSVVKEERGVGGAQSKFNRCQQGSRSC